MLYYHVECPAQFSKAQLDEYLSKGWYRMQDFIFTTDLIVKDETLLPVFWLRHSVNDYLPSPSHKKINKLNKHFSISESPLAISDNLEDLYNTYRKNINFEISPTLYDSLYGEIPNTIFYSRCIYIHDGNKLIAAGIFDEGETSIAGIINFYHPDYKSHSLGKYLMLQKMMWAARHQKQYYYTGYMSTAFSKFDYKTMLGNECTEVFNRRENTWLSWQEDNYNKMEQWLFEVNKESIVTDETE